MRTKVSLLLVTLMPIGQAPVWGSEPPVAVSPGNTSQLALVEASCPTFSWGEVAGAKAYKLVGLVFWARATTGMEERGSADSSTPMPTGVSGLPPMPSAMWIWPCWWTAWTETMV